MGTATAAEDAMTARKPPHLSFPDWIERQIRSAEANGAFQDLAGAGKPIRDIDRPRQELDWLAGYLRREDVDVAAVLPPALALAKEVETLPDRLLRERSEARARAVVEDLNDRIRQAHSQPQTGPPLRVRPVRVEEALEHRRRAVAERAEAARARAAEADAAAAAEAAAVAQVRRSRRRRFLRRR